MIMKMKIAKMEKTGKKASVSGEKGTGKEADESLFWADQIARNVKQRVEESAALKKIIRERGYIIYDEKTPSGKIHIGSGRGWVIHDVIAKSMRGMGLKARFILSSDDMDPFDKPNRDLPDSFNKYLGMPFRHVPSPVEGYKSFADYFFRQCTDRFAEFGIKAELESTGQRYMNGDFNWAIKAVLDNSRKIDGIYTKFYGKPLGRLPFNPICEKCGKIGTTLAYDWNGKNELVSYRCEAEMAKWARGCGHAGKISPYNGGGKLPWKVEWAAKWPTVGVVCELAGKDHFTKGGSRSISVAICDQIFGFPPPYPSTTKDIGNGYEFFTVGGKKMSTSKGMGIGFAEMTGYLPAPMIRYLLVRTRPKARVDFDPMDENDMILLYDHFDRTQRIYHGAEKVEDREFEQEKRIYEFSVIGEIGKKMPPQISLTYAATIAQVSPDLEAAVKILKSTGHVPQNASTGDIQHVRKRLEYARQWVEKLAPERYRFRIQERPDVKLGPDVKKAVRSLAERLKAKEWAEGELLNEVYAICKENGVETKAFFRAVYNVLIGKDFGPRLAPFILSIGKEKVAGLLEKA